MTELLNYAHCSECDTDLGPDIPEQREPCPNCGSIRRKVSISGHAEIKISTHANLTAFIDHSSPDAEMTSASALTNISGWVERTDRLTVKHVIAGSRDPENAGVPLGPFTLDDGRQIVETVFDELEAQRSQRWDRIKSIVPWILTALGLILTGIGLRFAYLRFFADN